ncbi:MAG: AMP-binding protein [Deltaproteobacteria bacterium]|nr:AMP-binding protein [Deltaproteobacteria bacterium]
MTERTLSAPQVPEDLPALSPLETLAGKHILILGTTGFLAKIVLSMLLERFSVGRIYVMIRATRSKSAEDRFWDEVMGSEMMDPLKRSFGDSFESYVRQQVEPVAGDLSEPGLGVDEATRARLAEHVDVVINSAGLVNFNPPLDSAVDANAVGAYEIAKFTKTLKKAKLVHVSTCYVAGARPGRVREDTPIVGYFPKQDDFQGIEFDWERELKDVQRLIQQVKDRTDDAALEATFKKEALDRLKKEKRDANPRTVRAAVTNQRRRWVAEEQIRVGVERAEHWGWPNIYTFTKALGEQAIASQEGLDWCIVRPAIVESALMYPFPGWNEGMNTSAPLAYLGLHGQVYFPGTNELILDVVPVDYVASCIVAAAAALLAGESKKVYQVAAGDVNPCTMARTVTLVALYRRRKIKREMESGEMPKWKGELLLRTEPQPVSLKQYERLGGPTLKSVVTKARGILDDMEPERYGPLGGLVSRATKKAREVESDLIKVGDAFDLFRPFIWENKYIFRTPQTRGLFARMNEADRALLPAWNIEAVDWRHYWLDVHIPGLEEWVFPKLETTGPKRLQVSRDYRDLVELFESRTREHGRRVAFRMVRKDDVADSFTYRDIRRGATAVAEFLKEQGVERGERVMLVSEGRPEWGMSYFGVIIGGGTVVPVDVELSKKEITNIAAASGAKGVIASEKQARKLTGGTNGESAPFPIPVWPIEDVFGQATVVDISKDLTTVAKRKAEDIASIIFTSGTTGRPKGVVLTDRNFTALTARMAALFELRRTDSLLSVLPPHHTFEFSAGLLMPLASGASVTYLEERNPDLIARAFDETPVSALIGVPAVWESLHRKIMKEVEAQGLPVEMLVKGLMRLNRWMRDRFGLNFGRWVFRPMQDAVGGRMRYMVSGAAALKSEIYTDFRGLGFSMYEGYGLTEASPVLTVGWPGLKNAAGSVGWPLPGIEVRIEDANDNGVGEIIARGPTIMQGYLENEEATQEALRGGWLHTGDQGRIDEEGRLFIVGREKDVIIDTGGKNVYPDEIEELYAGCALVKELSVVGIPAETGNGERVACLVVPDYEVDEAQGMAPEAVREGIRTHFKDVGSKLPFARRVKVLHLWEGELPRTSTRKVKRSLVREELIKLENTLSSARQPAEGEAEVVSPRGQSRTWVRRTVAAIANRKLEEVTGTSNLVQDLGFDSLMQLELLTALESEFPHARIEQEEMTNADTVEAVIRLVSRDLSDVQNERAEDVGHLEESGPIKIPKPLAQLGKAMLGFGQRFSYERLLDVDVDGQGNVPANVNFIVASNHSSHLDMGLVKYALGPFGRDIRTLAAKDYFFDDAYRRMYFENFTNLLPMDRHGSLKRSLRLASEAIRSGDNLLIFPEGTRARDGVMVSFKPAIGHLCLNEKVAIVPMYLGGTHDVLPVGQALPSGRKLWVKIGPAITPEAMEAETAGMSRSAAYRHVSWRVEGEVRRLGGLEPPEPPPERTPRGHASDEDSAEA